MSIVYLVCFPVIGACLFLCGYFIGRITEARNRMTRAVSLSDFSKLTQSR